MKPFWLFVLLILLTLGSSTSFSQSSDTLAVYPNPFAHFSTIRVILTQADTVTLKVFNNLGQVIDTLYDSQLLPADTFLLTFGENLPPGVYIVRLKIGQTLTKSKKAIKIGATAVSTPQKRGEELHLFPNPTTGLLHIPLAGHKTITVTDHDGRTVKALSTELSVFSIADLPPGIYHLRWYAHEGQGGTERVVKQ